MIRKVLWGFEHQIYEQQTNYIPSNVETNLSWTYVSGLRILSISPYFYFALQAMENLECLP